MPEERRGKREGTRLESMATGIARGMAQVGVDSSALVEAVRAALGYARSGGMPAELEAQVAGAVVDALLELASWRRGDMDPRRSRTVALAGRVARARAAGASIGELRERFGKSRSQVHRLLNVAEQHATHSRETAGSSLGRR
jgi:hypothetical protein